MSEPMSSGEIEDVLSSIRRLVSEDLRSAARPAFPATAEPTPAPAPPRLLLTPALRVVPPVTEPEAEPEPELEPEAAAAEESVDPAPEPEPEPPVAEEPEPVAPLRPEVVQSHPAPEPADHVEAWAGEPEPEPAPALDPRVARIGAGMAAGETWEAETGDPPLTRLSWIEVAESRDEEEAARAMPFVHRAPAPEPLRPEEPALIATTDEVLDEAVLREIVRDVLRDELQGHLGERITRNIRKLVRAEVHRALTLRDYE